MVEKGYNSDLEVRGMRYHIQTEDWGRDKSVIVTQIFRNGAVVKNITTPYHIFLNHGPTSEDRAIRLAMKDQHQRILDHLLSGQNL